MKSITVITHATGGAEIQDPYPAEGRLVVDIPASTTKTFTCTSAQYSRIRAQLDAMRSAGILTSLLVNETEEERSDKWMEVKETTPAPATRSGFGKFFVSSADSKPYFLMDDGTVLNLGMTGGEPLIFKGTIATAANFPTLVAVQAGHVYRVTADVTDNDVTKTNTGLSFLAGSTIAWTGVTWCDIGEEQSVLFVSTTPVTLGAGDVLAMVDTVTIAGTATVNLPAANASRVGKILAVVDISGAATALAPVVVTPNGTDKIDGVAAAVRINTAYGGYSFVCVQNGTGPATYGWATITGAELKAATTRLAAIGAGRSHADSRQLAAASEVLRVLRPRANGRIVAVAAETGTVAAAGESMTFDVQVSGATVLSAVITINDGVVIDTPVAGTLVASPIFTAGQLITAVRTYVAGGGATPMRDTVVDIELQLD
jgi:hypothetical protein